MDEMTKRNNETLKYLYDQIASIIVQIIGKIIVENEQNGSVRAEYGKNILIELSKELPDTV